MREIIFGLIVVLLGYIVWQIIRFARLKKPAAPRAEVPREPAFTSHALDSRISGDDSPRSIASAYYDSTVDDDPADDEAEEPADPPALPETSARGAEPQASGFEALVEVRQMRAELEALRQAHTALQEQVGALQEQIAQIKASSQVSPLYGEAVSLSQRGYDASVIAERCGISVAEAQLVRSLSSGGPEGEETHAES